jgi:hypothetical protein
MIFPPSTLGIGGFIEPPFAARTSRSLTALWSITTGDPPGALEADLERCRRWFDPVAQGQRLRRELPSIPVPPADIDLPEPPLVYLVDDVRRLVTPEGRCAIDLLEKLPASVNRIELSDLELLPYDRILGQLYQRWSRHRIDSVVKLLAGAEKPLQVAAAGVILALLVNRSTSSRRALRRYPAGSAQDVVDTAFFRAVQAFAQSLSPTQKPSRDPRLISGWMLYEARRRLGDDVLIIEGSSTGSEDRLWIAEAYQDQVLSLVTRDLARGHRARVTVSQLAMAFDALVEAFRSEAPRLAGFGLAHERPANTQRIRAELLEDFGARSIP